MAHPTTPVVPRDGQLVVSDNTGTPISYTIVYEDGDFSIDEVQEDYANTASMKDRGIWYNERKTDEQDLNFTFTCHVTHFSSATDGSPLDAVLKKGKFASGVSVLDLPSFCGSEHLAPLLPEGVPMVAAFKTISAHTLAAVDKPLDCDVLVCGNDAAAKARVIEAASKTVPAAVTHEFIARGERKNTSAGNVV